MDIEERLPYVNAGRSPVSRNWRRECSTVFLRLEEQKMLDFEKTFIKCYPIYHLTVV